MKSWPAGLITLLGTRQFVFCDLYTITLTDSANTVLYYTTGTVDVLYGGNLYSSKWLKIDDRNNKALAHWKVGLDVDTWTIYMAPDPIDPSTGSPYPATILGQPWLVAVAAGLLEGATVQIDRAYWAAWPSPPATPFVPTYVGDHVFLGRVAACDIMRNQAVITINSHLELFDTLMPRNLFQAACRHTLFDAGCALVQGSFAAATSGVIAPAGVGTAQAPLYTTFPGGIPGSGTLSLGQILFTSGVNKGLRRGVRYTFVNLGVGIGLVLLTPLAFTPAPGDTFTAYPGCDKSFANNTGCAGFSNQANYGGTGMTVPVPETAV